MVEPEVDSKIGFGDTVFSVVDVETTGSMAANDRMIEFAAYKVSNGRIIDEYKTLLNPGRHIPNFIRDMTGISNEMVYGAPSFRQVAGTISDFLSGTIFTAHNSHFDYSFVRSEMAIAGFDFEMPQLCTRKLSSRIFPQLPRKALDQVCKYLGIRISGRHRAYGDARATAHLLIELLELVAERHEVDGIDELLRFQNVSSRIDPHKNQNVFKTAMMKAPNAPGVYRIYDEEDDIIYVGKAKNLKLRIASYLTENEKDSRKVRGMLRDARKIELEITPSELSAFLRELRLIREHRPKFNSLLVNPRRFPFIRLSSENKYDRLDVVYELDDGGRYYGPFENSFVAEQVLFAADKYFKLVKCENDFAKPFDPCLYFHIERCMAPCRGGVDIPEYEREVEAVEDFLSGSFEKLTFELRLKLDELAKKLEFEEAIETRDLIEVLQKTSSRLKLLDGPLSKANFVCGWVYENQLEIYAVRRGIVAGPVVVNITELEPGLTFLLSKSPIVACDFVPLRILLNYALRSPQGFFRVDAKGEEPELASSIRTAIDEKKILAKAGKQPSQG
jgi:DNA polymerase-3 subunit epsilon